MWTAALLSASALAQAGAAKPTDAVLLHRTWAKGQEANYSVEALLTINTKQTGLEMFMSEQNMFAYNFATKVTGMDVDGIGVLEYRKSPVRITVIGAGRGEAPDVKPWPAQNMQLKMSPINEIIDAQELKDPKKPKNAFLRAMRPVPQEQQGPTAADYMDILGQEFLGSLYQMALWIGPFDSSLDFNPRLEEDPVKPGQSWKRTFSYAPQKTASSRKTINQRLDMTFTYKGATTYNGKPVNHVTGFLTLDNDMIGYISERFGIPPAQNPFKSYRVKYTTNVNFYLDPKTGYNIMTRGITEGSIKLEEKASGSTIAERQLYGDVTMKLTKSNLFGAAPSSKPSGTKPKPKPKS